MTLTVRMPRPPRAIESAPDNSARPTIAPARRRPRSKTCKRDQVRAAGDAARGHDRKLCQGQHLREPGRGPGPAPIPSRSMSVTTTPPRARSSRRCRQASRPRPAESTQPRTATTRCQVPSGACRPGDRGRRAPGPASARHAGEQLRLLDGQGPDDDPGDPPANRAAAVASSRTPPPTCTGTPARDAICEHEVPVGPPPSRAASRSTTCRREAPAETKVAACSSGSP